MRGRERPSVLVTGFGSFPGVVANPTEALIASLRADPVALDRPGVVYAETLAVDYRALPARLAELGEAFTPNIAIHFGVSGRASAFVLETGARNTVCTLRPDDVGHIPVQPVVIEGGGLLPASLPLDAMEVALRGDGLPVTRSDDAGDYLCNFLFYLSCGQHVPPFAPSMAGFIHVPHFGTIMADGRPFTLDVLRHGALLIIDACREHWHLAA